jgi:hypothetical protein
LTRFERKTWIEQRDGVLQALPQYYFVVAFALRVVTIGSNPLVRCCSPARAIAPTGLQAIFRFLAAPGGEAPYARRRFRLAAGGPEWNADGEANLCACANAGTGFPELGHVSLLAIEGMRGPKGAYRGRSAFQGTPAAVGLHGRCSARWVDQRLIKIRLAIAVADDPEAPLEARRSGQQISHGS